MTQVISSVAFNFRTDYRTGALEVRTADLDERKDSVAGWVEVEHRQKKPPVSMHAEAGGSAAKQPMVPSCDATQTFFKSMYYKFLNDALGAISDHNKVQSCGQC